jgi:hypothetical protein
MAGPGVRDEFRAAAQILPAGGDHAANAKDQAVDLAADCPQPEQVGRFSGYGAEHVFGRRRPVISAQQIFNGDEHRLGRQVGHRP